MLKSETIAYPALNGGVSAHTMVIGWLATEMELHFVASLLLCFRVR